MILSALVGTIVDGPYPRRISSPQLMKGKVPFILFDKILLRSQLRENKEPLSNQMDLLRRNLHEKLNTIAPESIS